MRIFVFLLLLASTPPVAAAPKKILIYTRNYTPDGKGYVHDNIAASVAAIQKIAAKHNMKADATDDPAVFADGNLRQYAAIVFSNSNNEAFSTEEQRKAFQNYVHAGHGIVALHSASGSERKWDYFAQVIGGRFVAHPKLQPFRIHVADSMFPAAKGLPPDFEWTDECYFIDHLSPDQHVVLQTDRTKLEGLDKTKLNPDEFRNPLPLAWYQTFDNSREFYLALGHKKEDYENPTLLHLIEGGIVWAVGK